eukprot:GHRR01016106.1.p1 GENE.GHRR01016106.1~~GHRR01016106.1.p1  ORF type:complete len:374 (+),score=84.39 GHRR01016106.1:50-1171(+)
MTNQARNDSSANDSELEQQVSSIAHDFVEGVNETVTELSDLATAFGAAPDFPESHDSDELDWDQFDIGAVLQRSGSNERLQAVKKRIQQLWNPKRVMLRDKVAFLLGSCQVWATAYWLGWSPSTFYKCYTFQVLVLMLVRWGWYRHKKWHYYLLDFCYFANLLLLIHLWVQPKSQLLRKVTFAYNTGPLTWSIVAFRNSLVYHDLDKVTSVFLHLAPACVTWTLHWHPDADRFGPRPDASEQDKQAWQHASFLQLVVLPLLPYVIWATAYYLKIFVVSAERIRQRGYITLFTYVTTTTKGVYAAIAKRVPLKYRPQVYLFLHMCFCGTTFTIAWLCWHHFHLHTMLLAAMGAASIWHGATFYFDVFAKKSAPG